ncbi:uncharacterized protein METZ01_LOCUS416184 [marine metagenome]|uniref:Uncharacterized protein n=1 Tax=marine metagenome TaxID=408172 RepID=A0A382WXP6_9ZZZZ
MSKRHAALLILDAPDDPEEGFSERVVGMTVRDIKTF